MNLVNATSNGNEPNDLLFVNFNQDCTSLAVGTKTGYRLYTIISSEKLNFSDLKNQNFMCTKNTQNSFFATFSRSFMKNQKIFLSLVNNDYF